MIIDPYVWFKTPILSIEHVSTDTVIVSVAKPDDYEFSPGQYTLLRVETEPSVKLIRQYSFCSATSDAQLSFLIRSLPLGKVSGWLYADAKRGDLIEISKPYGRFGRNAESTHHVYIAGGVGIAPFLSMIDEDPSHTTLLYSERSGDKVVHEDSLRSTLKDSLYVHISETEGRITTEDLVSVVIPDATYYLCGSKEFVDTIESLLLAQSIPASAIKREAFTLQ